ncbi:MAG TPA: flagellar biosynthesis anti-sigma factor FlgM [Polyangiaceae bacterium]|jgi:flagellar biosynthesis anti-sigma factor FlgM
MKGITGNPVLDAYQQMAVAKVGAPKPVAAASASPAGAQPSTGAAEVNISSRARDLAATATHTVNHEKVSDLKSQISNGTYQIDSHAIAQRLIDALG